MKQTLQHIVGKTIQGVVVKTQHSRPRRGAMSLFLCFTDGSHIEIWTDTSGELHPAGGLDPGGIDEVMKYSGVASILMQKCWFDANTGEVLNEYHSPT